jgi:hypothetical protein
MLKDETTAGSSPALQEWEWGSLATVMICTAARTLGSLKLSLSRANPRRVHLSNHFPQPMLINRTYHP